MPPLREPWDWNRKHDYTQTNLLSFTARLTCTETASRTRKVKDVAFTNLRLPNQPFPNDFPKLDVQSMLFLESKVRQNLQHSDEASKSSFTISDKYTMGICKKYRPIIGLPDLR